MDSDVNLEPISRAEVLERVWRLMSDGQPRTSKQIAAALAAGGLAGVDKSLVNSVLAREGKGRFAYDPGSYSYSLAEGAEMPASATVGEARPAVTAASAVSRQAVLDSARELLADGEERKAKQIAAELVKRGLAGVDKSLVNSVLAREGRGVFEYDRESFTYRLGSGSPVPD